MTVVSGISLSCSSLRLPCHSSSTFVCWNLLLLFAGLFCDTQSPSPNKIMLTCPMMNLSKHGDSPHQSSRLDPGKNHLITRARPLIILFAKTPNGKRAQACRNRARAHQKIVSETVRSLLSLDLYLRRLFLLQAKDALISLSLDLGKGISSKPFSAVHAFRSRRSSILGLGYLVILSPHMSHQHQ